MKVFRNLELHVAHSCNLTCESCSHYSNQGHKGLLTLEKADHWMNSWNRRLDPKTFSLLGGEPTIHPRLPEFVTLSRKHWPQAHLRIVTNGFFLHHHPTLPQILQSDPNAALYLSVHHRAEEYQEKLRPVLALLREWVREYGIKVRISESSTNWTRRYKGFGAAMEPFEDGNLRQSWEKCPARFCRQLFEGQIWKCAPLAYLKLQDAKYGLSEKWKTYLGYAPLSPECSDEELNAFFEQKEESYCGMCPAKPEKFQLPLPLPRAKPELVTGTAGKLAEASLVRGESSVSLAGISDEAKRMAEPIATPDCGVK